MTESLGSSDAASAPLPARADTAAPWTPHKQAWNAFDWIALAVWTAIVVFVFREVVFLQRALFYFDITEINFPYRDFFANELKAGRFSRWIPGLYCGHPLYSESQAGYLHPFKYLLYPWLPTWQAFGLDCVLSIWLTGAGAYCWLRRHVGCLGAWTGCAIFAFGGYMWAHFIHTSMLNALASVPLAFWSLELAWDRAKLRYVALGGLALACQVFAGHLQDVILTGSALAVYGLFRAATEPSWRQRAWSFGAVLLMGLVCIVVSAVQWIPSKDLIDRSPRAGGLSWDALTYGSWSPELLPAMLVREAYGTRARDTDWMDGFYPHLEMNSYVGVVGLGLAIIGLGAARNRWVAFWPILAALALLLMLGRFTFLMDIFPHIPFVNTGRVPVRYHLWFTIAIAALASVGVDRLVRGAVPAVNIRAPVSTIASLAAVSICILFYVYQPAWTERGRWRLPYHADRYGWLASEMGWAIARTCVIGILAYVAARIACRRVGRPRILAAAAICGLVAADLLLAHANDVPTIEPAYWTSTPATARWLLDQPDLGRIYGEPLYASGEPAYASQNVDFMKVRELLAWSLPPVWGINSTAGETPIIPMRRLRFTEHEEVVARFDVEGLSHVLAATANAEQRLGPGVRVGGVTIHRNAGHLPRARLLGKPAYASSDREAAALMKQLNAAILERIIVEDPDRPIAPDAAVRGTATIVTDEPERVVVDVNAETDAYLFLADSYDPGWSATLDGQAVPIRPAYAAFRAVFVPKGQHTVTFSYEPSGFRIGLIVTALGALLVGWLLFSRLRPPALCDAHATLDWPSWWPRWLILIAAIVIAGSIIRIEPGPRLGIQQRWDRAVHRFTWGAGIEAMRRK